MWHTAPVGWVFAAWTVLGATQAPIVDPAAAVIAAAREALGGEKRLAAVKTLL